MKTQSVTSPLLVTAAVLLTLAVIFSWFAFRTYRIEKESADRRYTTMVKLRDVASSVRKAAIALHDAEIREQNYVLTGETTYSEGYGDSVGEWQDEAGVLGIQTTGGPLEATVQDFTKAGDRTIKELAFIVSLYDQGSREKALDRIRKGAGIVYLDRALDLAGKIIDGNENEVEALERDATFRVAGRALGRMARCVVALFCLTCIGALALSLEARRQYRAAVRVDIAR